MDAGRRCQTNRGPEGYRATSDELFLESLSQLLTDYDIRSASDVNLLRIFMSGFRRLKRKRK